MTTEYDISVGVLRIAATRSNGVATFKRCWNEISSVVHLSSAATAQSQTRPGEEMWQQLVRNIKSHHIAEGNFIYEGLLSHVPRVGYKITAAGQAFLNNLS